MTTDPETYTFIASDSSKCQDTGFSAWCIPTPRNASHLLRSRTWSEYFYALLAHCYDTATAYIPNALYAYFCPQRARFIRQKQRWVTMDAEVTKTCMRKEDAENGYWKLAYLGELLMSCSCLFLTFADGDNLSSCIQVFCQTTRVKE